MKRKWLAIGIILLFVAIAVNPITGISSNRDDTTPPVTTISLNPPEPDGENGWYVCKVTITLNATDNESGVNITEYCIDWGAWMTYIQPFNITTDNPHHEIRYRSIDNAGNIEPWKSVTFAMDRTKPIGWMNCTWEGNRWVGYTLIYQLFANDKMSGMNRVEFYINGELHETIIGPGPNYESIYPLYYEGIYNVRGFILNPEITDEYVKFYSILVTISAYEKSLPHLTAHANFYDNAGNWDFVTIVEPSLPAPIVPGIFLFQNMTLPNNYTGHIGRFFIKATFYDSSLNACDFGIKEERMKL